MPTLAEVERSPTAWDNISHYRGMRLAGVLTVASVFFQLALILYFSLSLPREFVYAWFILGGLELSGGFLLIWIGRAREELGVSFWGPDRRVRFATLRAAIFVFPAALFTVLLVVTQNAVFILATAIYPLVILAVVALRHQREITMGDYILEGQSLDSPLPQSPSETAKRVRSDPVRQLR